MNLAARARLERLLEAARRIADPRSQGADEWRERVRASSGLSRAGVDLALAHCLEVSPSEAELEMLAASVEDAPKSHVLLSANVFVATHRAIALALAASSEVCVRASRREPEMTRWLQHEAAGLFDVVEKLTPKSGEQVFAYGNAETLEDFSRALPAGVRFWGHGPGFGLVVCQESAVQSEEQRQHLATRLAFDLVLFDQRGCLSPRLMLFEGSDKAALSVARELGAALGEWEARVPRGELAAEERAEVVRYAATLTYAGEVVPAARGVVGVAKADGPVLLPPAGRNLHIVPVRDAQASVAALSAHVTTFAVCGSEERRKSLARALPNARQAEVGRMQCPAFDGPVDRRTPLRSALTTFFNPLGPRR